MKSKIARAYICTDCGERVSDGQQSQHICKTNANNKLEKISESLMIGYDSNSGTDISALSVVRLQGTKRTVLNTFFGEEADWMYDYLTNDKTDRVKRI